MPFVKAGTFAVVVSAAAHLAQAQGLGSLTSGLSSQCQGAAVGLLSGDFGSCSNILGLTGVLTASGSVISPLSTWINSVCGSAPCSSSVVQSASSSIQSGCSTDIQNGVAGAVALNTIVSNYPEVRNLLCLQYSSNSSNCVIQTLTDVQTANKTDITVSSVQGLLAGGSQQLIQSLNNVPTGAYCTDCGHAIFTEVERIGANQTSASSSAQSAISSKCGSSFTDGQIPSDVTVGGSSSSSSSSSAPSGSASNSAASSLSPFLNGAAGLMGVGVAMAAAVAGAMVVLA